MLMAIHSACCEEIRNTFFFGKKTPANLKLAKQKSSTTENHYGNSLKDEIPQ